jgi:hypothetical protein
MQPRQKTLKTKADSPKMRRLVMDKVAERQKQESDQMAMLNKDLIEIALFLVELANEQRGQVEDLEKINLRLKWIMEKYIQIDSNMLDSATIAKLYKFMAEADGVQIVPMTYPKRVQE